MEKGFIRKRVDHMKKIPKKFEVKETFKMLEAVSPLPAKKKSSKDIQFLLKSFKSHFLFYALGDSEIEEIIEKMFYCEAKKETMIFKQGDDATAFFIIEKGTCSVIINEQTKKQLSIGDSFGDLALLYNAPRSASIKTIDNCFLWGIDRNMFRNAMEELSNRNFDKNRAFIEDIKFFQNLTEDQKDGIASVLTTQKFVKNQNIVVEGDPGSSYYIIKEGTVSVLKGKELKEVRKLYKGESFGEQALYYNTNRTMTCRAYDDNTICLALGRDMMVKILGDGIQVIMLRNTQRWAIQKSVLFSKLTKLQIEKILDIIKIKNYKAGDLLIKKGTIGCPKLIIIMEGSIRKESDQKSIILKGGIFGDEYFLDENKKKIIDDNLIADKDSTLGEITFKEFEDCIGGSLSDVLQKNENSHEKKMTFLENNKKGELMNLKLSDFYHLKKLGQGQFGSVYLIKTKEGNELYALKCVAKQQIIEQNLEKYLQQERMVCDLCNFPFIMQFMRTYKDDFQVYFLLEYIKGMELFDVIREIGLLKTYDCQYYIGSMILAIEYLHTLNIVYRDLKPENVMIDSSGVLKLIDMGTAKTMKGKGNSSRTFTIIGTPHYMAPEIIAGKGYGFLVDLWSIGICFYEFMCGMVPFGEEAEDPYEIYEEIIKKTLKYPNYVDDKKAKKLMEQLLNKVPEIRLGTSYAALKSNPFFSNFDWDKLLDKLLKPPYLPPKEKIISDKEIEKIVNGKKPVLDEIMVK